MHSCVKGYLVAEKLIYGIVFKSESGGLVLAHLALRPWTSMLVSYSLNCSFYKPGLGNTALPLIQGCCEGSEKLFQKDITSDLG